MVRVVTPNSLASSEMVKLVAIVPCSNSLYYNDISGYQTFT
jgi:hypothetical protein